jgi:hypothetical protein
MKEEETTDHTDGRRGMINNELIHTDLRESILGVAMTLLNPYSCFLLLLHEWRMSDINSRACFFMLALSP